MYSVIAITGLDGHAYGSWRGKGNLGRMWLRDFLSKDLPNCRTMVYGYNSKLSSDSSHGVDTILDYGRGLLEELKKVRNTDEVSALTAFSQIPSWNLLLRSPTPSHQHPTLSRPGHFPAPSSESGKLHAPN